MILIVHEYDFCSQPKLFFWLLRHFTLLITRAELFKYYIIHFEGSGGKSKYNDHIIDGGGGLENAKNG